MAGRVADAGGRLSAGGLRRVLDDIGALRQQVNPSTLRSLRRRAESLTRNSPPQFRQMLEDRLGLAESVQRRGSQAPTTGRRSPDVWNRRQARESAQARLRGRAASGNAPQIARNPRTGRRMAVTPNQGALARN
ncbi:hypothetical protein D0962_22880 [Leptolyngbyaceae cyanobacterium CCMR0082]|uniref:Uncharacterized protein n=1 Tax=Adonisia turfae CCMR0082 TaxID=2304604 RepID=A0A6M0SAN7_9CYAN|nr:hypothetical protein [Adonisia turfae]NEZ65565.1 hypothetical protein [Adonisia turfae CCMR0082]